MTTKNKQRTTATRNKEELDRLRSEELKADVLEGFAEIERGEYVVMTQDELLEKIKDAQANSG